ncbi:unnamed protein product, partial [Prunus brigantina]
MDRCARVRVGHSECPTYRGLKALPSLCILVIFGTFDVISAPRMRQSLAFGITKLISVGAAYFGNLIRIFPCIEWSDSEHAVLQQDQQVVSGFARTE